MSDQNAFRQFFYSFQPQVYRFLYRFVRDAALAEDLTQETFVSFWSARNHLDSSLSCKHYLFRIARNQALAHLTRKKAHIPQAHLQENLLAQLSQNPEEAYERSFTVDELQRSISLLPERCRAVFILIRYHGFSYQQAAQTLEISLQTVKNQMNKALATLRKRLAEHLD